MANSVPAGPIYDRSADILGVVGMTVAYNKAVAVRSVDLHVGRGECVGLLGANGAGKSSVLNSLMGLVSMAQGSVVFDGSDISRAPAYERADRGMGWVPEGRGILKNLTVQENLVVGTWALAKRERAAAVLEALQIFPRLHDRRRQLAGSLSGGEQTMLVLARAIVRRPRLMILDEPTLGLAPRIASEVIDYLIDLKATDMSLLVAEQNIAQAERLIDRAYVLETGKITRELDAQTIRNERAAIYSSMGDAAALET